MLWVYAKALWHQWKVFLTGGSLMALTVIYSFATAHSISKPWGWGLLAGTLLLSSFGAWKEEHLKNEAFADDKARMEITDLSAWGGMPDDPQFFFGIYVRLENPGKEATNFSPNWTLDVVKADGERVEGMHGKLVGEIRPMQQGDQFTVQILFRYNEKIRDSTALYGSRLSLTVADLRGRPLRAEWPTV